MLSNNTALATTRGKKGWGGHTLRVYHHQTQAKSTHNTHNEMGPDPASRPATRREQQHNYPAKRHQRERERDRDRQTDRERKTQQKARKTSNKDHMPLPKNTSNAAHQMKSKCKFQKQKHSKTHRMK